MNDPLISVLYIFAGIALYGAIHHGLRAWRRPVDTTGALFVPLCLLVVGYVITKAGVYQAESVEQLVAMRRWDLSFGILFFAVLPWFVASHVAQERPARLQRLCAALSAYMLAMFAGNLLLPYGISFEQLPVLEYMVLPWHETVVDVRVHASGVWHLALWGGIFTAFACCLWMCASAYRRSPTRSNLTLAFALFLFLLTGLGNQAVNLGLLPFVHTIEFGFVFLVAVMDIELVRQARDYARRVQGILDNVPASICVKDIAGRYVLCNDKYLRLFRLQAADVIGRTDAVLFSPDEARQIRRSDRRVLETLQPLRYSQVFDHVGDQGSFERHYDTLKFPLLDSSGIPTAVCSVLVDVSEMEQASREIDSLRHQVWHVDRVLRTGALSASLAHELSQPLAAILSNAQAGIRFLQAGSPDLRELQEIFEDIVRDDHRASRLVSGVRSMLRKQESPRTPFALRELLDEMQSLIRTEMTAKGIRFRIAAAAPCPVLADRAQLQQVLLNLLMNAIEAVQDQAPVRRRIDVTLRATSDAAVLVEVRDAGEGIPEEDRRRIFEPFHTTKTQGLGMGLVVCSSIIEAHGGRLWLETTTEHGTVFAFTLPMFMGAATATLPEGSTAAVAPEPAR
jgi:PAS domain S-box-containing protein